MGPTERASPRCCEFSRRCLCPQAGADHGFYARLTARENLLLFGQLNLLSSSAAAQRIWQLAEQFHLGEALDRQVRTLSTGTVQRLRLARALLHQPSVLLLGAGIAALWRPLAVLLLFAALLLPLSMSVFGWSLRRTKITGTLTHS